MFSYKSSIDELKKKSMQNVRKKHVIFLFGSLKKKKEENKLNRTVLRTDFLLLFTFSNQK